MIFCPSSNDTQNILERAREIICKKKSLQVTMVCLYTFSLALLATTKNKISCGLLNLVATAFPIKPLCNAINQ